MLVCDELGDCYDDGTGTVDTGGLPTIGTNPVDSGNPCDPSSVAYDPTACANATPGGYGGVPGADVTPGIGYFEPSVPADQVTWCQANPGSCDQYGPTAAYVGQYCQDNPTNCGTMPDGTVGTIGTNGTIRAPGGGTTAPGVAVTPPAGGSSGFLSGLSNFLGGLFQTCPTGYIPVQTANGQRQCVRSGTIPAGASAVGFGNGMIGGVSIGTIAIILLVLFLIARKK